MPATAHEPDPPPFATLLARARQVYDTLPEEELDEYRDDVEKLLWDWGEGDDGDEPPLAPPEYGDPVG